MGGKGFYRGISILMSGTAGTGKTSVLAVGTLNEVRSMLWAGCRRTRRGPSPIACPAANASDIAWGARIAARNGPAIRRYLPPLLPVAEGRAA